MRKISIISLVLIFNFVILLASCGENNVENDSLDSIIGTWQMRSKNEAINYTFNEDGSFDFVNETANIIDSGEYRFEDDVLYLMYSGNTDKLSVIVVNDIMVCYGLKQTLERQYYTESDSDANGVYGIWKSQLTEATWFIYRDNTISDLLGTYGFTQCGDIYVAHFLDDDFNTCPIAFTYDNDEITLYLGPVMRKIN